LAKLSGQSGEKKFGRPEKKIRPPTKFEFLKAFLADENFVIYVYVPGKMYNISLICTELRKIREEKLIFN
jgi:hypothetical protein